MSAEAKVEESLFARASESAFEERDALPPSEQLADEIAKLTAQNQRFRSEIRRLRKWEKIGRRLLDAARAKAPTGEGVEHPANDDRDQVPDPITRTGQASGNGQQLSAPAPEHVGTGDLGDQIAPLLVLLTEQHAAMASDVDRLGKRLRVAESRLEQSEEGSSHSLTHGGDRRAEMAVQLSAVVESLRAPAALEDSRQ